jgi:PLD-like domain
LKILRNAGCTQIRLLVRLCAFTSPSALRETRDLGDVQVRFFTDESFHAKFYILGNVALIGSANLTGTGLNSNRELSVTVTSSEERFDDIPALFDELWQRASVLTDDALEKFTTWSRKQKVPVSSHIDGIDDISPQTVKVESKVVTRERTYLESYRQEYYETLISKLSHNQRNL